MELLTTTYDIGSAAINLTGNGIVQRLIGNAGVNTLNGLGATIRSRALAGPILLGSAQPSGLAIST
jgi:hypothetical protein